LAVLLVNTIDPLILIVLVLLVSQIIVFIALDWNNVDVKGFSSGQKLLVGYFQAASTRTAGMNVINLGVLQHGTLVYYVLMMYVAIYPLVYSIRASDKSNSWREMCKFCLLIFH
jgi:Trk-type K+ transport system membrane component